MQARGISSEQLRTAIEDASGLGSPTHITPADMTPRTKKIIESAAVEAQQSGVGYIGTEHLLLAILTERENVPAVDSVSDGSIIKILYEDSPLDIKVVFDDPNDKLEFGRAASPKTLPDWHAITMN